MSDIPDDNWSERDDRNAEVAPLGFPPGLPAQIELIGRMMMGAIKRFWNKANPVYATTGTADDYVVTPEGQTSFIHLYEIVRVRIDRANTTATPTLKFGLTNARTIVKVSPSGIVPLVAGDLVAGQDHSFWYNGTSYVLSNPGTVDSASVIGVLKTANALSELTPAAATARTNIGAAPVNSPTFTGTVTIPTGAQITSPSLLGVPTAPTASPGTNSTQLATTAYADALGALKLSLTGGTMSGVINMGSQKVTNLANGTASGDAVNKSQLDVAFASVVAGYLFGLTTSNNALDAANDIDFAAGTAASDAAASVLMTLASTLTKRLDANWSAGTNQGGLDTGAKANSTWYYLWLIQRSDTLVVDACFSASATTPTLGGSIPVAYDRKRRIGAVRTDGSGNILAYSQTGDDFWWTSPPTDFNASTITITASLLPLTIPAIQVSALINVKLNQTSVAATLYLSGPSQADVAPTSSGPLSLQCDNSASGSNATAQFKISTSTQQIRARSTNTTTTVVIVTLGWSDARGRV